MLKSKKQTVWNITSNYWLIILLVILGALIIGGCSKSQPENHTEKTHEKASAEHAPKGADVHDHDSQKLWTCPMHPEVMLKEQEPCPLCGMNLVPAGKSNVQHQNTTKSDHSKKGKVVKECWTCPMHPNVMEEKAGPCPVCGMDLVTASCETGQTESKTGKGKGCCP